MPHPFATLDAWWERRTSGGTRDWPAEPMDLDLCRVDENNGALVDCMIQQYGIEVRYPMLWVGGRWYGGICDTAAPRLIPESDTVMWNEGVRLQPDQRRASGEWLPEVQFW